MKTCAIYFAGVFNCEGGKWGNGDKGKGSGIWDEFMTCFYLVLHRGFLPFYWYVLFMVELFPLLTGCVFSLFILIAIPPTYCTLLLYLTLS